MMSQEEVVQIIENFIEQAKGGLSKETSKFDFKRKWYNLKEKKEISEFLKDTSAMANTVGPDDGLIVIGFDEKDGLIYPATFSDCGLRDSNEISGLVRKKVDTAFDISTFDVKIQEKSLSVIQIPNSFKKPHVIKGYDRYDKKDNLRTEDHRIFLRKGTSTQIASKYDIDFMYYVQGNQRPEYDLSIDWIRIECARLPVQSGECISFSFCLENTGYRTISIRDAKFTFEFITGDKSTFSIHDYEFLDKRGRTRSLVRDPLVIRSGDIVNLDVRFFISGSDLNYLTIAHELTAQNKMIEVNKKLKNIVSSSSQITLHNGKMLDININKYT